MTLKGGRQRSEIHANVVAYDRHGNTGTYWVDGSDITKELKIDDREP